jgi:hypothetical protein
MGYTNPRSRGHRGRLQLSLIPDRAPTDWLLEEAAETCVIIKHRARGRGWRFPPCSPR